MIGKKKIALVLAAIVVASSFAGCGGNDGNNEKSDVTSEVSNETSSVENSVGEESSGDKGELTIGWSWAICNDSIYYAFQDTLINEVDKEAKDRGYSGVEWVQPVAGNNAQKQADDIEDLITMGVDAVVCYPYDMDAIKSSIESCRENGIPFITYDHDATEGGEQPDAWIGLDSETQAYEAGVALFQKMEDEGVEVTGIIELIGALEDINTIKRKDGFARAAEEFGYEIDVEVPTDWSADTAVTNMSSTWQTYNYCNVVLSQSDIMGPAAVQSVAEPDGMWVPNTDPNHIWFASCDVYPETIQLIRDGYVDYDAAYDVQAMAETGAPVILDLIEGIGLGEGAKYACDPVVCSADNIDSIPTLWSLAY